MSIFFNQRPDGINPSAQFYNGQANISTSSTSSPFTALDGRTFAERYAKTQGIFIKIRNHYEAGSDPADYVNSRTVTGSLIDQASNQGLHLGNITLGCDTGTGGGFEDNTELVFVSLQDKWDGTFTGGTVSSGQDPFGQGVSQAERWYFVATQFNSSTDITLYVIDPDNGNLLLTLQDTELTPSSASTTASTQFKLSGAINADAATDESDGLYLGEVLIWDESVPLAELQAFAQVGFGVINRPQNLILDWNFLVDWRGTNALDTIDDKSASNATGTFGKAFGQGTTGWDNFSTDNPVPVFIPSISGNEHDVLELSIFSGTAGTCYFGTYPSGATAPTEAEIVAGTGALSTGSILLDGVSVIPASASQPDTGTDYVCYLVQDENDLGSYGPVIPLAYTSATKYSETVVDIDDTALVNLSAIQYTWYDSTDFDNLGTAKTTGTVEVTDGAALLEITLPTSITTAKGSDGTMVLKVDDGGTVRTAAHVVTVK